jgi:hypothetical protein
MANASVRSVMQQLAATWETMAERELVSHVLDDVSRELPEKKAVATH